MKALFIVILAALALVACQTTQAAPPASVEAQKYRAIQGEIQKQQADLAITGVKIEAESRGIVEGLKELEKDMVSVPEGNLWLPQIQALGNRAEGLRGEAEKLNVQLESEREINRRQAEKFNTYEASQARAMSERDTKIAILEVENKKGKGKRNTLLAIVITAITIIVLYLVFKILRALRIVPF
ncbi:MAG: hypothetical protein LBQ88_05665 [Treponema sp.]|jgi:hypothetical protein|nr:hypothetical protein [Treponema sp.]